MMRKSLNANYSAPFQVGAYENYLSKLLASVGVSLSAVSNSLVRF